jgi:hypothetical protein
MVPQEPQGIGVARVLHVRGRAVGRDRLGPRPHRLDLREIEGAEAGGHHAPLRHPALPGSFQPPLQPVQDVSVVPPARNRDEPPSVPHAVDVRRELNVNHARLVAPDGRGPAVDRLLGCPLRALPVRPVVTVGCADRL